MTLIPLILSGGAGTRLWPLSTENHPKQFLKLRQKLEKSCSDFTNYDSHQSYLNGEKLNTLLTNPKILQFFFEIIIAIGFY